MKIEPGQVAVVTGGTSGIGFALADHLLRRGVHVVIADVRAPALPVATAALSGHRGEVVGIQADVAVFEDVQTLADTVVQRLGRVDLVCNNAGVVSGLAPMWEQSLETWRWLVDVKLMGVVHGVRAFAPLLIAQGSGHILNTASAGGLMPLPSLSPYSATMHAVVGVTETLNIELRSAARNVGATVLCPGLVNTALAANSTELGPPGAGVTGGDAGLITGGIDPSVVAEAALAAVEADRVHAIVGPGSRHVVRSRVDALLADLD